MIQLTLHRKSLKDPKTPSSLVTRLGRLARQLMTVGHGSFLALPFVPSIAYFVTQGFQLPLQRGVLPLLHGQFVASTGKLLALHVKLVLWRQRQRDGSCDSFWTHPKETGWNTLVMVKSKARNYKWADRTIDQIIKIMQKIHTYKYLKPLIIFQISHRRTKKSVQCSFKIIWCTVAEFLMKL